MEALAPLHAIRNEDEYDRVVAALNSLLDDGAGNERHPMAEMVSTLGELIAEYDVRYYPPQVVSSSSILKFLMEQHRLTASQMPEVGSADMVRSVLDESANLTDTQVTALAHRFKLSESVFK